MIVAILQPGYLPWLGFFEQMYQSDVFVLYDDVAYDKHGWRNRNRIKTPNGAQWLTVPVLTKGRGKPAINEVLIDQGQNWRKKHLASIRQNYSEAPCFDQYIHMFEEAYSREWERIVDLDVHFIEMLAMILGLERPIHLSSTLTAKGDRVERLINICKEVGADTFYEGAAGKNYIEKADFEDAGIGVKFQDYQHQPYKQLYGDFVPHLSTIDLVFNHGEKSAEILLSGNSDREVKS